MKNASGRQVKSDTDHPPSARQAAKAAGQSTATLATRAAKAILAHHHRCNAQQRSRCHSTRLGRSHLRLHRARQPTTSKMQIGPRAPRRSQAQITLAFLFLGREVWGRRVALCCHALPRHS